MKQLIAETIECMRIMQDVEEVGDCWLWQGSLNAYGYPQYRSATDRYTRLVKRMMWKFHGNEIGYRVPLGCTCGEKTCINPAHHFESTNKAIAIKAAKAGAYYNPVRHMRIAQTKRKTAKLTIEQAREIRLSTEPGPVLALKYGVDRTIINGIKAGKRWKDYSNPYSQLMAA